MGIKDVREWEPANFQPKIQPLVSWAKEEKIYQSISSFWHIGYKWSHSLMQIFSSSFYQLFIPYTYKMVHIFLETTKKKEHLSLVFVHGRKTCIFFFWNFAGSHFIVSPSIAPRNVLSKFNMLYSLGLSRTKHYISRFMIININENHNLILKLLVSCIDICEVHRFLTATPVQLKSSWHMKW